MDSVAVVVVLAAVVSDDSAAAVSVAAVPAVDGKCRLETFLGNNVFMRKQVMMNYAIFVKRMHTKNKYNR